MKLGTGINIMGILAGVWIFCAPYIVGYAPHHGSPWSRLVLGSDILALIVIVSAVVGLAGFWGGFLKALTHPEPHSLLDQ